MDGGSNNEGQGVGMGLNPGDKPVETKRGLWERINPFANRNTVETPATPVVETKPVAQKIEVGTEYNGNQIKVLLSVNPEASYSGSVLAPEIKDDVEHMGEALVSAVGLVGPDSDPNMYQGLDEGQKTMWLLAYLDVSIHMSRVAEAVAAGKEKEVDAQADYRHLLRRYANPTEILAKPGLRKNGFMVDVTMVTPPVPEGQAYDAYRESQKQKYLERAAAIKEFMEGPKAIYDRAGTKVDPDPENADVRESWKMTLEAVPVEGLDKLTNTPEDIGKLKSELEFRHATAVIVEKGNGSFMAYGVSYDRGTKQIKDDNDEFRILANTVIGLSPETKVYAISFESSDNQPNLVNIKM